ncbi:MAG: hypothetical protein B6I23_03150 [Rickettsiaceae bacterium 4572_127]|nr:MAG: hypothetical protein B6I23_03150 [Rickettsiaceae bacterium 4572_127]
MKTSIIVVSVLLLVGCSSNSVKKDMPNNEAKIENVKIEETKKTENLENQSSILAEEKEIYVLTESSMRDLIKNKTPPSLKRIEVAYLRSALASESIAERYALNFEGESRYYNSNEQPLFIYAPVISPIKSASLGFSKAFSTGMKVGIYNEWEEKKISNFDTHGRNSAVVKFEMDLFKNFLGRQTLSELNNAELEKEISEKEKEIAFNTFSITTEKLYWNLVAIEEQIFLLEDLIKISEKQTNEIKRRYVNGVADGGDLARQKASLSDYRAEILGLEYQKESLHQTFKETIPFLSDKEIKLGDYDLDRKEKEVLKLITKISKHKKTPLKMTLYDEINLLLIKAKDEKLSADSTHSDIDLSFFTEYRHLTDDPDFQSAVSDMSERGEESYAFGVKFSVPLTSEKRTSERLKKRISELEYDAKKEDIDAKLNAYHFQTKKIFNLLTNFLKEKAKNTKNLKKTVRSSRRKYTQARTELRDLIADQNLYLRTAISEIDGKLLVIHRVLDYLTVFSKMKRG